MPRGRTPRLRAKGGMALPAVAASPATLASGRAGTPPSTPQSQAKTEADDGYTELTKGITNAHDWSKAWATWTQKQMDPNDTISETKWMAGVRALKKLQREKGWLLPPAKPPGDKATTTTIGTETAVDGRGNGEEQERTIEPAGDTDDADQDEQQEDKSDEADKDGPLPPLPAGRMVLFPPVKNPLPGQRTVSAALPDRMDIDTDSGLPPSNVIATRGVDLSAPEPRPRPRPRRLIDPAVYALDDYSDGMGPPQGVFSKPYREALSAWMARQPGALPEAKSAPVGGATEPGSKAAAAAAADGNGRKRKIPGAWPPTNLREAETFLDMDRERRLAAGFRDPPPAPLDGNEMPGSRKRVFPLGEGKWKRGMGVATVWDDVLLS